MKLTSVLLLLPALAAALPGGASQPQKCCLCDSDVTKILKLWVSFYESNDYPTLASLADKVIANEFKAYDETFMKAPISQGTDFVSVNGKADLLAQAKARVSQPDVAPRRKFRNVFTAHSCDTITFRWEYQSTIELDNVGGLPLNQTLAPVGKKIQYKGIDFLRVDCASKKVKAVYTSQDWFNQIKNLGFADWSS